MQDVINGFSQERVLSISKTANNSDRSEELFLDCIDLQILRWLIERKFSFLRQNIGDDIFFVIDYEKMLSELPVLHIKRRALCYRLDKFCELGLLEKREIVRGSCSWFKTTEKLCSLLVTDSPGKKAYRLYDYSLDSQL